jgi:hypothetical protein
VGPDGSSGGATLGLSYFFVGLASNGHSVWAPQWADYHTFHQPYEATILAALAAVGGVRYSELYGADPRIPGDCSIYEAGSPTWPAPGPNYVRVGTSGTGGIPYYSLGAGLPLYARANASPTLIQFILSVTKGTPD